MPEFSQLTTFKNFNSVQMRPGAPGLVLLEHGKTGLEEFERIRHVLKKKIFDIFRFF